MKHILPIVLTAALVLLSACSAPQNEERKIDLDALAEELLESGIFEEELNPADGEIAEKLYGIDDAVSFQLYVGSGATASELALLRFEAEEDAQAALLLAQERVAAQKESFASYLPGEVEKLEEAIVERYGHHVVVCVSEGDADEILSKYFRAGD